MAAEKTHEGSSCVTCDLFSPRFVVKSEPIQLILSLSTFYTGYLFLFLPTLPNLSTDCLHLSRTCHDPQAFPVCFDCLFLRDDPRWTRGHCSDGRNPGGGALRPGMERRWADARRRLVGGCWGAGQP